MVTLSSCEEKKTERDVKVWAFYYPYFGEPETDGQYSGWDLTIGGTTRDYPGGDDIGSNFYPEGGCYSVNDPLVLDRQMQQLKNARVGGIIISWWGPGLFEDIAVLQILEHAQKYGIKVSFMIEEVAERDAGKTRSAIQYLLQQYGSHAAFYRDPRYGNRPLYFINDSQKTEAEQWATLFQANGAITIRDTDLDGVILAVWLDKNDGDRLDRGGFDGAFTYLISEGVSYGSIVENWPKISDWSKENGKIFVPCVGPGYNDTRWKPWNSMAVRLRAEGHYYDRMWERAIELYPPFVFISSFNDWANGTQIEPAVPKTIESFKYLDYSPHPADYYLSRTALWSEIYTSGRRAKTAAR